jgi:hypothetical protein
MSRKQAGNSSKIIRTTKSHPGGIALLEWTHSDSAIKDTPAATYDTPGIHTRCHVEYCPPIALSPILLPLLVSCFESTLWSGGQVELYIVMGSFCTRFHCDSNVMGDAVKISPRIPSTCTQSLILSLLIVHIDPIHQIYVVDNNSSLARFSSSLTTSQYRWTDVPTAGSISHAEYFLSHGYLCIFLFYKFQDGIHVTLVLRLVGDRKGPGQYTMKDQSSFMSLNLNSC